MFDLSCRILSSVALDSPGYREVVLDASDLARAAQPGQFVHVRIPSLEATALRRPFSISEARPDGRLRLLFKVVGRGTEALGRLTFRDRLQVMGPIGRGFPLEPEGEPLLVGGGYGVAPLGFLAERLPRKGILFVGGRKAADILGLDVFRRLGWEVRVATQDGSMGERGFVTQPLDAALAVLAATGRKPELYACGPNGMLKAIGERAARVGCKAWLSLDQRMVCGVGACLACVQKLRGPDGSERLGRVCVDGPVFESREIVWE